MGYEPKGKHLVAGEWLGAEQSFESVPVDGPRQSFSAGTPAFVDRAAQAAEAAFWSYGYSSRGTRAAFLNRIADEVEARAEAITEIGSHETGLPRARLEGERGRTTFQLRLFADHILDGAYLDRRHDSALPDRAPLPRPDLKMVQRPIGPVAVFGASNFPLAFSTAGGDTASALAAGCPVVVKGHEAHPGTSEIVAEAIRAAITHCDLHPGVFSLIQGGAREVGQALVQHPLIKAVGFTGSLAGGRALFDLCAARPEPIPFFGELGSINPVFLLPEALKARWPSLAERWTSSLAMGAGQFCTNPGVAILIDGSKADAFTNAAITALERTDAQVMLTDAICTAYDKGCTRLRETAGVKALVAPTSGARAASPGLFETTGRTWLETPDLHEEVFGPAGIVIRVADTEEMKEVARALDGQLTCTFQMENDDLALARELMPILERKAGRILANGFPTGVEVADAMVHGGPYPASTNFGATSVGTLAIRRFLRPVCFQNMADALVPDFD